ncbi:hypothetical protein RP20_CCG019018 [Aedes albopictus]|nr:hypothetical protein RP20_CCG019018 [Aedes albopictus]
MKVDINDRTISIISEALGGSNVENCPHACVARPCGPLAKCVPNLDSYECQCNPQNKQCNKAEELPSEVIEQRQRLLKLHQVHRQEQQLLQEQPDEDDDFTTTVVPSTKAAGGKGDTGSGEDDYYYYEYDDDESDSVDPESKSRPNENSGRDKNEEKIIIRAERQQADVTTTQPNTGDDDEDYRNEERKDGPRFESDSYGDLNDGYNKDYDHNGDRIPYRPDLVKKVGNEPRITSHHKNQPERNPDFDETLIEEMNRIMKNKDDGYESDDVSEGGPAGWDFAMDDEEIRHTGSRVGGVAERPLSTMDDDNENGIDGTRDAVDDDGKQNNRFRDEHTNFSKGAAKMASSGGSSSSSRSSTTNNDRQHQKHLRVEGEDDVSRSVKYKNKYYRRYQGACFTGTESFFHYSDAETMRRVISYEIDLNLRFKTHSLNGLILWTGRHSALEGDDFLSLGVENGFLHLRYNLGSGEVNIKYNSTKVSDGLWHRVRALRNSQDGTLKVDGGKPITRRSPGKLRQLNTDTGLYVGE